jgi:hypothetical protein
MPDDSEWVPPETIRTCWINQSDELPTLKAEKRFVTLLILPDGAWSYGFYTVVAVHASSVDVMMCADVTDIILHTTHENVQYVRQCPQWDGEQIPIRIKCPLLNTEENRYAKYNNNEQYINRNVPTSQTYSR